MTIDDIKKVVIAGAGTMGASMAQIFAQYGYEVSVYDAYEAGITRGKHLVELNQESMIDAEVLTPEQSAEAKKHIVFTMETDCMKDCDIIIESVLEKLDVKQDFWEMASGIARDDCIFCTNTSGLSITQIGAKIIGKGRFCGMHWNNPPHIIPLIEVINTEDTDENTAKIVSDLCVKVGKKPIYVKKDAPGFIFNRIQAAIVRESLHIVEEGIGDVSDVDICMKYGLGFRYACLGPLEIVDQGGLDVHHHIASYLWQDLSDAKEPYGEFDKLYKEGHYGVKTGSGFYDYSGDKADKAIQARDAMYFAMMKCNPAEIGDKMMAEDGGSEDK